MQRPRDTADVRFWPRKEGGQGFRRDQGNGYRFSALRTYDKHRHLMSDDSAKVSIVATPQDYTPDTVRSRARAALVLAIQRASDQLSDDANELKLNELSPVIASLGRISGVAVDDGKQGSITVNVVRVGTGQPPSNEVTDGDVDAQPVTVHTLTSPDLT